MELEEAAHVLGTAARAGKALPLVSVRFLDDVMWPSKRRGVR
jgi:hypothetical protein